MLHGYQDGHGRLAGSVQNITPQDAALMSQMSDWSGYRDPAGKDNTAAMREQDARPRDLHTRRRPWNDRPESTDP